MKTFKHFIIFTIVFVQLFLSYLYAEHEIVCDSLDKSAIEQANSTIILSPSLYPYKERKAKVTLIYTTDDLKNIAGKNWSYKIKYVISSVPVFHSTDYDSLMIEKTPDYDIFETVGLHEQLSENDTVLSVIEFSSTNTGNLPTSIFLKFELESITNSKFDISAQPIITYDSNEESVNTTQILDAEEYEFEWVYIDKYQKNNIGNPFKFKDPIRVITKNLSYPVDLSYPEGNLYYRVRAIGRHEITGVNNEYLRRPGVWSNKIEINIPASEALEKNKNWQYTALYSEGGKRKKSINYFDGTFRDRQSVVSMSSDSTTIVNETKYDFEGRSALTVLPAPRKGKDLHYTPKFNSFLTNANELKYYDKEHFNKEVYSPLSDSTGAGRYYSGKNDVPGPHRDYIPDSEGYPFSVNEYSNDNTGRLKQISGIGKKLLLPEYSHNTRNIYGNANTAIQQLFGSNLGVMSKYKRIITIDPNNVARANYYDNKNRIIATSVVGDAPDNIISIAPEESPLRVSLNDFTTIDSNTGTRTITTSIANVVPRNYKFTYDITGVDFIENFEQEGYPALCSTCKYQLTIRITNPFGKNVPLDNVSRVALGENVSTNDCQDTYRVNEIVTIIDNAIPPPCTGTEDNISSYKPDCFPLTFNAYFPAEGKYEVFKELKLVDGWIDTTFESQIVTNQDYFSPGNFKETPDSSYCIGDCERICTELIIEENQRAIQENGTALYPTEVELNNAIQNCIENCENVVDRIIENNVDAMCQKIKDSIDADIYRNNPGLEEITPDIFNDHRESCHHSLCIMMKESDKYDSQMGAVNDYTEALTKGYLNPLNITPGENSIPEDSDVGKGDPYFIQVPVTIPGPIPIPIPGYAIGSNYKTLMEQYLLNFTDSIPDYPKSESDKKSLWEFVADREINQYSEVAVPLDRQWQLFKSIYLGIKQYIHHTKVMPDRGCYFFEDGVVSEPVVYNPFETSVDQLKDAIDNTMIDYCESFCPVRAERWVAELREKCKIEDENLLSQVKTLLEEYCLSVCDFDNPLGLLTNDALNADDPILVEVQTLLGSCPLDSIAVDNPYDTIRICNEICCTDSLPHTCIDSLVRVLNYFLPADSGDVFDLDSGIYKGILRDYCLNWIKYLKITEFGFQFSDYKDSLKCEFILFDKNGDKIPIASIDSVANPKYQQEYPFELENGSELKYRKLVLEVKKDSDWIDAFVFSNCPFPYFKKTDIICYPVIPKFDSYINSDIDSLIETGSTELITEWSRAVLKKRFTNLNMLQYSNRQKKPVLKLQTLPTPPVPWSCLDYFTLGISRLFKLQPDSFSTFTIKPANDNLYYTGNYVSYNKPDLINSCIPCLGELIGIFEVYLATANQSNSNLSGSTCFKYFKSLDEAIVLIQKQNYDSCYVVFADSNGTNIPIREMKSLGKIHLLSNLSLSSIIFNSETLDYTGLGIEITLNNGRNIVGFIFSNCDFKIDEDCFEEENRFTCGIAQRPDECFREIIDNIDNLHESAIDSITPTKQGLCYDRFYIRDKMAVFLPPGEAKGKECIIHFYSVNGFRLNLELISDIRGEAFIAPMPSTLNESDEFGLHYTGFAVRIRFTWDFSIIAYVYSNCIYETEDDCDTYITGFDFPDLPKGPDPVEECLEEQDELAELYGLQGLEYSLTEYEDIFVDTILTRCFDPPFKENFYYEYVRDEYHYTIFQYDMADNLIFTVPPAGIDTLKQTELNNLDDPNNYKYPNHRMATQYKYNSINQITWQKTPDGGVTRFWYNDSTQLRFSQNAQQFEDSAFSYIVYDEQNRIIETGVLNKVVENYIKANLSDPLFPDRNYESLTEITHTLYDSLSHPTMGQQNLRGRVSAILVELTVGDTTSGTYYSYDPHGNVNTFVQYIQGLGEKRIDYELDILSQNILAMYFQKDSSDQFIHKYQYDADNRLTTVRTSRDGVLWDTDAKYYYYKQGPLARSEIGDAQVQGVDYVYTLQGWLKGVNSNTLFGNRDPGHDGDYTLLNNPNSSFAKDSYGFTLGFYPNDYKAIGSQINSLNLFEANTSNSSYLSNSLFDGNINHMVTAISKFMENGAPPQATAYKYDQLYRLKNMKVHRNIEMTTNSWRVADENIRDYATSYEYNANGNFRTLTRYGREVSGVDPPGSKAIDSLTYHYYVDVNGNLVDNRLLHINDKVHSANDTTDIDDQGIFQLVYPSTHNYTYGANGNLIRDFAENIDTVKWNSHNRVSNIRRNILADSLPHIEFKYDGLQNRIVKIVQPQDTTKDAWKLTYYIRDPNGKILATYKKYKIIQNNASIKTIIEPNDLMLYGSNRLGIYKYYPKVNGGTDSKIFEKYIGLKQFEQANQISNVLATISDRRLGIDSDLNQQTNYFNSNILNATDYFPFGMIMTERLTENLGYKFGFNGMEKDDELKGNGNSYDFGARFYDPRVGVWLSLDPVQNNSYLISSYAFVQNNPINYFDPNGEQEFKANYHVGSETAFEMFGVNPTGYSMSTPINKLNMVYRKDFYYTDFEAFCDIGFPGSNSVRMVIGEDLEGVYSDVYYKTGMARIGIRGQGNEVSARSELILLKMMVGASPLMPGIVTGSSGIQAKLKPADETNGLDLSLRYVLSPFELNLMLPLFGNDEEIESNTNLSPPTTVATGQQLLYPNLYSEELNPTWESGNTIYQGKNAIGSTYTPEEAEKVEEKLNEQDVK